MIYFILGINTCLMVACTFILWRIYTRGVGDYVSDPVSPIESYTFYRRREAMDLDEE